MDYDLIKTTDGQDLNQAEILACVWHVIMFLLKTIIDLNIFLCLACDYDFIKKDLRALYFLCSACGFIKYELIQDPSQSVLLFGHVVLLK